MSLLNSNFKARILNLAGDVLADPLPATSIRFTKRLALPGDRQLGTFSIDLIPPRGPNAHLFATYEQAIDYQRRIEIYEDGGSVVFAGYVVDSDISLTSWSVSGECWACRLKQRRAAHFQYLNDQIVDLLDEFLHVWDWRHFLDTFNRTSIGSDWTATAGDWSIVTTGTPARQWLSTTGAGPTWAINHTLNLSTSQDDYFRVWLEFQTGTLANDWNRTITVFGNGGTGEWILTIEHTADETKTLFTLAQAGADDFRRHAGQYELPFEQRASLEFWIRDSGSTDQTCEIYLNARSFMLSESTLRGISGDLILESDQVDSLFDNVIIFTRTRMLTGNITSSSSTIEFESPNDPQFGLISMLSDTLQYQWRVRHRAAVGADLGQDIIDMDTSVGSDLSSSVILREGVNLTNVQLNPSASELVTWFIVHGQGADKNQSLAQAWDATALSNYDIIEGQLSNPRVSEVPLAQSLAESELLQTKDGEASLAASVLMTPGLSFDVGDTVRIECDVPDLSRDIEIVSISRESGSAIANIVAQKFPRSRSGMVGRLNNDVGLIQRQAGPVAHSVVYKFNPGARYIDDVDSRVVYTDSPSANPSGTPPTTWSFWISGLVDGAYGSTLHAVNLSDAYCEIDLNSTEFGIISRQGGNLTTMDVTVDGGLVTTVNLRNAATIDQQIVYTVAGLAWGAPHRLRLNKNPGGGGVNRYISVDAIRLNSMNFIFFVEARAVNEALLSWTISNTVAPPSMRIVINGVDATTPLGGPFTASASNIDISQWLSAPGLASVDFIFSGPNDTELSAEVNCKVFV